MITNPLYMPQRERSGSYTISKFSYQHHWSLFQALQYYKENIEFILCGECHDDVLFLLCKDKNKPLSNKNIIIEVNQVKAYKKPITLHSLLKVTKDEPSSVIGKMVIGVNNKTFERDVSNLSLVSESGFSGFKIADKLKLETININHLIRNDYNKVVESLGSELLDLGITYNVETISKINFVSTTLKEEGMDSMLIGEFTKVLEHRFSKNNYHILNIYRTLIDDARRKSIESYDHEQWEKFVNRKGITNSDLDRVREAHLVEKSMPMDFGLIDDLDIGNIKKRKIRNKLISHHNLLLDKSKNIHEAAIYNEVSNLLAENFDISNDNINIEDIIILIDNLSEDVLLLFDDEDHKIAAIIYGIDELIRNS